MIKIIVSRYPSHLSKKIYEEIESNLGQGIKSFLLVPDQYTLQTDIDFIESINFKESIKPKTVMDAKILSFNSFSRFITDRLGADEREILDPNAKLMLISNILTNINDSLDVYKNYSNDVDFIASLSKTITEIRENKLDEKLFNDIDKLDLPDELKYKLSDLEKIYKEYIEQSKSSFSDAEARLEYVTEKLKEADFLKDTKFYFDKFDSFSDLKLDMIKALSDLGLDIVISLTLEGAYIDKDSENDLEMFDNSLKLINRIDSAYISKVVNIDKKEKIDQDIEDDSTKEIDIIQELKPEIAHLVKNFERFKITDIKDANLNPIKTEVRTIDNEDVVFHKYENIDIYANPSTGKEIENAALFIKKQIKTSGKRFRDFSLYITDKDEYESEIIKAFSRNDIPYFMDEVTKLSENHIIKTYLAGLRLVIDDFKIDDLKYFASNNIADFGKDRNVATAALLNFLDERNITRKMFTVDKYFDIEEEYYNNLYASDKMRLASITHENKVIKDLRSKIIDLLDGLYKIRDKEISAEEIATLIYEFITHPIFKSGIKKYQSTLEDYGFNEKVQHNQQAISKFIDILDQLVLVLGDRKITLKTAYDLIDAASSNTKIGAIPPSKDHVIVSELTRSSVTNRPINMILGLNDAYFPASNSNKNILTNNEIDKLKSSEVDIDFDLVIEDVEQAELRDLYKIFTASDYLYLSYAKGDKTGEGLDKASVLNQINNIFYNIIEVDTSNYKYDEIKYSRDLTEKYAMDLLRSDKDADEFKYTGKDLIPAVSTYLYKHGSDHEISRMKSDYDFLYKALVYSSDKPTLDKDIREKMFGKNKWSASQIERYANCPYQHFISYGIRPNEPVEYDISSMDEGNIVHNIFEDVSELFIDPKDENGKDISIDEVTLNREKFDEILKTKIDNVRLDDPRNKFTIENMWENTNRNFNHIKDQLNRSGFKVVAVEQSFDKGADDLANAVEVGDGNYLTGRIDRIDTVSVSGKTFARVIDYKTGNKSFRLTNVLNLVDLQLVIYIMSLNETDEYIPVGAFYLPLREIIEKHEKEYDTEKLEGVDFKNHRMDGLIIDYTNEDKTKRNLKQILTIFENEATGVQSVKATKIVAENDILTGKQADGLIEFVKKSIVEMIGEIKKGDIKLHPVVFRDPICKYCAYKGICKIDPSLDEEKYRKLESYILDEDGNRVLKGEDK